MPNSDCVFCKIASKDLPSYKIYENEYVYAFLDINPTNKGHTLVIPKTHFEDLFDVDEKHYTEQQKAVRFLAKKIKDATGACGVNIIQNNKACAGQVVNHIHIHIIPRFEGDGLKLWPSKQATEEELEAVHKTILDTLG